MMMRRTVKVAFQKHARMLWKERRRRRRRRFY